MPELTQSTEQPLPHILILDDEADIRQMVSLCLQKSHFRITCVENVAEACKLLVVEQFDAIISDVMMPGEDGIEFLGRVHDSWPDLPVILMTGHAQLQMAVNAIKNGAFDFIHKPFDFDHLRKIVLRAVNYSNLQKIKKNYHVELEETVAKRTSELKASLAELDFARAALQQAASEKSTFMATISHEMRTPMNGVIGSLDLLAGQGLTGVASEYLCMAQESADNMIKLINQLLSFNSLKIQGIGSLKCDLLDLPSFLQSLISQQQQLFTKKGLLFTTQLAADLPPQIWTNGEKLNRLLEILLGNALKFTNKGTVELLVSRQYSDDAGESLLFSVIDSGIGVPEGMLERIFEPFVQGDGSLSRRHEGVGLGLAIAHQNATLLNGNLWAEHVTSGGSRFNLTIKISTP